MVSAGHVLAGSAVHAWVGLTLIVIDVTVWAAPSRVAGTFVAVDEILTPAVDAGVATAFIHLRQTGSVVVAFGTEASEAVDAVDARAPVVTRVDGAVVNVDVTHCSCVARLAGTLIAVDFVDAPPVVARLALTVVKVHLTIETCGSFGTGADVGVLSVLAGSTVLAWLAQTLVDVGLTQAAGVARTAVAREGGQPVFTGAVVAGIRVALIDVYLTMLPCISFCTFAGVFVGTVGAFGSVFAGCTGTLINVHLTQITRKTFGALAVKGVDLVNAFAIVETRLAGTLVCVDVAEHPFISWHTDAVESSDLIQAGGVVMARIRHTFVDVHLTARSFISLETFTLERPFGVEAAPAMFARIGPEGALVDVQVAG